MCGSLISIYRVTKILKLASWGLVHSAEDAVQHVSVAVLQDYVEHLQDDKLALAKASRYIERSQVVWAEQESKGKEVLVVHLGRRYRQHFEDLAASLAELTASQAVG